MIYQNELEERKNYMKMQDVQRYQSEQLNDLEEEERRKNEELRQRAFAQVQEQEDEIKQLNEVICVLSIIVYIHGVYYTPRGVFENTYCTFFQN